MPMITKSWRSFKILNSNVCSNAHGVIALLSGLSHEVRWWQETVCMCCLTQRSSITCVKNKMMASPHTWYVLIMLTRSNSLGLLPRWLLCGVTCLKGLCCPRLKKKIQEPYWHKIEISSGVQSAIHIWPCYTWCKMGWHMEIMLLTGHDSPSFSSFHILDSQSKMSKPWVHIRHRLVICGVKYRIERIWDDPDCKTTPLFKTNLQKKTLTTTMCFSVTNSHTLLSVSGKRPLRGAR